MTLTLSVANLKSFIKNSCFAKARKCQFQDALDEWKTNISRPGPKKPITIFDAMNKSYYGNFFKFHSTISFFRTTTDQLTKKTYINVFQNTKSGLLKIRT
jgi:hypothetical protein